MVRSEIICCKECGKRIAFWDMFSNVQWLEEWECDHKIRENVPEGVQCFSKSGKERKTWTKPCALTYKTKYCRSCAEKLKYKCTRPGCKGTLRKVRNIDGSCTKDYGHGGF